MTLSVASLAIVFAVTPTVALYRYAGPVPAVLYAAAWPISIATATIYVSYQSQGVHMKRSLQETVARVLVLPLSIAVGLAFTRR
jgi:hypothetical protein